MPLLREHSCGKLELYSHVEFFSIIINVLRFPTILNELVEQDGQNLEVCEIVDVMIVDSNSNSSSCQGNIDLLSFEVMIVIGGAFTLFYIIFSFMVDYIGRKKLLSKSLKLFH